MFSRSLPNDSQRLELSASADPAYDVRPTEALIASDACITGRNAAAMRSGSVPWQGLGIHFRLTIVRGECVRIQGRDRCRGLEVVVDLDLDTTPYYVHDGRQELSRFLAPLAKWRAEYWHEDGLLDDYRTVHEYVCAELAA